LGNNFYEASLRLYSKWPGETSPPVIDSDEGVPRVPKLAANEQEVPEILDESRARKSAETA